MGSFFRYGFYPIFLDYATEKGRMRPGILARKVVKMGWRRTMRGAEFEAAIGGNTGGSGGTRFTRIEEGHPRYLGPGSLPP
jgi:hypothetical protein